MAFALILILFAWVMQGPWARGFRTCTTAGYVSLSGTILFVVALIAMLRAGGRLGWVAAAWVGASSAGGAADLLPNGTVLVAVAPQPGRLFQGAGKRLAILFLPAPLAHGRATDS